ncbi:MAG: DUF1987 domain-containing protein [Bacteroidales bacterium]|nr:DUF1987 domain-containing protein [Bacteroidales bacterium]
MESLIIEKTNDTPSINFNIETGIFRISDTSWPEDAKRFYTPILEWLKKYFEAPKPEIVFEFDFNYFNTSSAKIISKILKMLKDNFDKSNIKIKWFYDVDDLDMKKAGERYSELLEIKFEFIEIKD